MTISDYKDLRVSILLVLYKSKDLLPRFIECLRNQSFRNFDLYAIDCHNNQESITYLKEVLPDGKYFEYLGNLGYSEGNNFLFKKSNENYAYPFSFIINPDVLLGSDSLKLLVDVLIKNPDIVGCGPIIYNSSPFSTARLQNLNFSTNFFLGQSKDSKNHSDINLLPELIQTQLIPGCAILIRKTDYLHNRLFPSENYMYGEELDFSYRTQMNGGSLMICRDARVWHLHDFKNESKDIQALRYYYIYRNRILFFRRYKMYKSLGVTFMRELLLFPSHFWWALKIRNSKLLYAIYLGLLHGYIGISGRYNGKL
jgi:GT2 family glycosyltransferase